MNGYRKPHTRWTRDESALRRDYRRALLGMTTGEMVACVTLGAVWILAFCWWLGWLS